MLRNSLTKLMLNSARKSLEIKSSKPNMFSYKPKSNFSNFNSFFTGGRRPLYMTLIGLNVATFVAWNTNFVSKRFLYNHFALSLDSVNRGFYHTFLTYSFSHINFMHLLFNMVTLYFFGSFTEYAFGSRTLLHLYLIGALTSGLFIHASNKQFHNQGPTVGASGATSAILAYYVLCFPKQPILLFFIPVPAWMAGALLLVQSLMMYDGRGGISGSAHLGGLVGGFFYFLAKRGKLF